MLKMIIADDEYIVREGLKSIIPWEEFGIEVVSEAMDGQEAYDLCLELNPDILFTDIRMPMMDGLEVALKLKEQNRNIKIIIISGVQDFNYAKTALTANAVGYILKPVKIDELKAVISQVVNSLRFEKSSKEKLIHLKQQLHENLPVLREKFLRNLLTNLYIQKKDLWEKAEYYSLPFQKNESLLVSVLQIDEYERAVEDYKEDNKQLLTFTITNITEEILKNLAAGICFSAAENELVLIFNNKAIFEKQYVRICEEISSCINRYLNITVTFGLGSTINSLMDVSTSYKEALAALEHKFYTGNNTILDIHDVKYNTQPGDIEYPDFYMYENQLISYLKLGDSENAAKITDEIFNSLLRKKNLPIDYVQNLCAEIASMLARNIFELGESLDAITASRSTILDTIYNTKTIFELKEYMLSIFLAVSDFFQKKYNQKNLRSIKRIKEIIDQQYMKELGISEIAKEIYLSPNYISLIFKQETGETITEYITKARMEAAKQLIRTTNFKILEIAEMVGYDNPHYFSTVFRKYTGIHPQKFRSISNEND